MPLPDQICVTMSVKNLCNLNLYNLKKNWHKALPILLFSFKKKQQEILSFFYTPSMRTK